MMKSITNTVVFHTRFSTDGVKIPLRFSPNVKVKAIQNLTDIFTRKPVSLIHLPQA